MRMPRTAVRSHGLTSSTAQGPSAPRCWMPSPLRFGLTVAGHSSRARPGGSAWTTDIQGRSRASHPRVSDVGPHSCAQVRSHSEHLQISSTTQTTSHGSYSRRSPGCRPMPRPPIRPGVLLDPIISCFLLPRGLRGALDLSDKQDEGINCPLRASAQWTGSG